MHRGSNTGRITAGTDEDKEGEKTQNTQDTGEHNQGGMRK